MDDPKAKFVEAAVRPLSDNAEQQAAARSLLEISVPGSAADKLGMHEVVARFQPALEVSRTRAADFHKTGRYGRKNSDLLDLGFTSGAVSFWCLRRSYVIPGSLAGGRLLPVIPIACAAAFIPARGWAVAESSDAAEMTTAALGGILILWLLMIVSRALFGSYEKQIVSGTVARGMMPPLALAAVLAIAAAPYFKARAFYWSGKDTLVRMDKDFPTGTEFEHRVALQYRKETREMMGDLLK